MAYTLQFRLEILQLGFNGCAMTIMIIIRYNLRTVLAIAHIYINAVIIYGPGKVSGKMTFRDQSRSSVAVPLHTLYI